MAATAYLMQKQVMHHSAQSLAKPLNTKIIAYQQPAPAADLQTDESRVI
jgi:hypothetical protein